MVRPQHTSTTNVPATLRDPSQLSEIKGLVVVRDGRLIPDLAIIERDGPFPATTADRQVGGEGRVGDSLLPGPAHSGLAGYPRGKPSGAQQPC